MRFDWNVVLGQMEKQKKQRDMQSMIDQARKQGADIDMEYDIESGQFIPHIKYKRQTKSEQLEDALKVQKMIMDMQKSKEDIKTSITNRTRGQFQDVIDPITLKVKGKRPKGSVFAPYGVSEDMTVEDFGGSPSQDTTGWLAKFLSGMINSQVPSKKIEQQRKVKDQYGFNLGEVRPAKGKNWKYIGNNQWQPL